VGQYQLGVDSGSGQHDVAFIGIPRALGKGVALLTVEVR